MPAIDQQRLDRQIETLLSAVDDPAELRRQVRSLVESYTDRTRRAEVLLGGNQWAYAVPRPVLRRLGHQLALKTAGNLDQALAAADALWRDEQRDQRLLAAMILGAQQDPRLVGWIEKAAADCRDQVVMMALALEGLRGWRAVSGAGFRSQIQQWLASGNRRLELLALLALADENAEGGSGSVPEILRLIEGLADQVRGENRQALRELVRSLIKRSPQEAAHFLLGAIRNGGSGAVRIARDVLGDLPERHQERLREALKAHRSQ